MIPIQPVMYELLWTVMRDIYKTAADLATHIGEDAQTPARMKDLLINVQSGIVYDLLSKIDGNVPNDWPQLALINAETGEVLSGLLQRDWSQVESDYLYSVEPGVEVSDDGIDVEENKGL